jgi:hypothetical protein
MCLRHSLVVLGLLFLGVCSLRAATPSSPWTVTVVSTFPSGVALTGEVGRYTITVKNNAAISTNATTADATLLLEAQPPGEPVVERREWPVRLGAGESGEFIWEAPTARPGYLSLSAVVFGDGGRELARTPSALLVTPPVEAGRLPAARSFFGTLLVQDCAAAARIGVRVERFQAWWTWLQPKGPDEWAWRNWDQRIRSRTEQGIGVVLCLQPEMRPKWAKWKSVEELADPALLPEFSAFVRTVVSRYKDDIIAVEIMNEPDLEAAHGASGKLPTAEVYARILKAGYEASKSVAPELPVIGLDVSGVDFPRLRFSDDVLSRTSGYMDIIGGHPYNHSRYLGGDALPESPLKMDAAGRMAAMAALMRTHGLPPRIWSTEFGWALHLDEPLSSPSARLFAAYTAQAIVLSRSVPEVEKLFWFGATFPARERASSYGMFRKADERANFARPEGPWYPSPSAAAYATCARLLDDVTFVRQFTVGPFCHALRFADAKTGGAVIALWMEDTESVGGGAKLRLPAAIPAGARIIDTLGRETALTASESLELEPLPVFVVVAATEADAMETTLRAATVEARERLVVQSLRASRRDRISLDVINNDLRALSAKVFQAGGAESARSLLLEPGVNALSIPADLATGRSETTSVTVLDERTSATMTTELRYRLLALPRIAGRAGGGWAAALRETAAPVVLVQRDQVLPADPGVDWKGPDDLSLTARAGWTPDGVALVLEVRDDVHTPPPTGAIDPWGYDSVQVAFDMGGRATASYDDDCFEYALAGGAASMPPGSVVRREGAITRYEVLFPWSWLGGRQLSEGDVFRMNFIANDNDGGGRKCWIGLTPGIGEAKRPAAFYQWILR